MTQRPRVASPRAYVLRPPRCRPDSDADWATLGCDLCLSQWAAATERSDRRARAPGAYKRCPRLGREPWRREPSLRSLRRWRRRLLGLSDRSRVYSAADMEPEPEPEPVTLLVKSPNQRHRDLELSGDRSWSVGHLKAHLSRVYPERPVRAAPGDATSAFPFR